MELLIYPVLGIVAGLAAGLLGVGGGLIIVPVLIYAFTSQGFSPEVLTHMAVGTALATMIVTSSGSAYQHHRNGAVVWSVFLWFAVGLSAGALLGAKLADLLHGRILQILLGCFAILLALQMAAGKKAKPSRALPGKPGLVLAGGIIGSISAIFGIGGGSLSVPFFSWCNMKMQQAVATSAAGGLPIAVAGSAGFIYTGWNEAGLPPHSVGYIYIPALIGIAITSVVFSQIGAHWAHRLPAATLKKIFAALLVVVGIKLVIG
ncbi:sulfite exporter TauE/SafE family protein [Ketobacter sp. MCCC 1A13808]|uniref:sulfite exporter TauE/SafE family protein n=1 Tax=Ketobacter sp. MCCC 1A13808 TaxID=2602738 RepID=UPI000F214CA3|nr:sulfite exporter TauE/SafE family protein [Ketobacter sp. MCCC 1A13808]MVF12747.1 sulfite exporter TauE/SafE family protein [Ketobacter sp. MCCC 1A13808]RLP54008.1 MAG: sulfite exporter TauE/SafE family protein [Ketobacter sp.]